MLVRFDGMIGWMICPIDPIHTKPIFRWNNNFQSWMLVVKGDDTEIVYHCPKPKRMFNSRSYEMNFISSGRTIWYLLPLEDGPRVLEMINSKLCPVRWDDRQWVIPEWGSLAHPQSDLLRIEHHQREIDKTKRVESEETQVVKDSTRTSGSLPGIKTFIFIIASVVALFACILLVIMFNILF